MDGQMDVGADFPCIPQQDLVLFWAASQNRIRRERTKRERQKEERKMIDSRIGREIERAQNLKKLRSKKVES